MTKINATWIAVLTAGLWFGLMPASAQEKSKDPAIQGEKVLDQAKEGAVAQAKMIKPYRLDFSLNEVEDGKVLNTRRYSMDLTEGETNEIKIGTRVPIISSAGTDSVPTQFQYLDVGTRIAARLERQGDEIKLHVNSDTSNIDTASAGQRLGPVAAPIVRQIKIEGSTLLVVGKAILVGSVDDPNSKRQFQLEVTVTKLGLSAESACTYYDEQNRGFEGRCGTKRGDPLHAYCTIDGSKLNDQDAKNGKKLYQIQAGCLGV